jgi:hypothetical protein
MPGFLRNHRKKLFAAYLLFGIIYLRFNGLPFGHLRGRTAAHIDIALGHYTTLTYGIIPPWRPEYARLLNQRYGVKLHTVAGCIVSESTVDYVESYNEVVESALERKFKHNVSMDTYDEARSLWIKSHPEIMQ